MAESESTALPRSVRLRDEALRVLIRNLPFNIVAMLACAAIITVALWSVTPRTVLLSWVAAVCGTMALVGVLTVAYRRKPRPGLYHIWEPVIILGAFLSGVLWASAAVFLFPTQHPGHEAILIVALIGAIAGGAVSLVSFLPAFRAYVYVSMLPVIAVLLAQGDFVHTATACFSTFAAAHRLQLLQAN